MENTKTYSLDEVVKLLKVSRYLVCEYQKIASLYVKRDENGHRVFSNDDLEKIKEVKDLDYKGVSPDSMPEYLTGEKRFDDCTEDTVYRLEKRCLVENERINHLKNNTASWFSFQGFTYPRISRLNFPQVFFQIIGLYAEDCEYNLHMCYAESDRLFIEGTIRGQNENCSLLLYYFEDEIRLTGISFIHDENEKMTALFKLVKKMQYEYEVEKVTILAPYSEQIKGWCKENDLKVHITQRNLYVEKKERWWENKL